MSKVIRIAAFFSLLAFCGCDDSQTPEPPNDIPVGFGKVSYWNGSEWSSPEIQIIQPDWGLGFYDSDTTGIALSGEIGNDGHFNLLKAYHLEQSSWGDVTVTHSSFRLLEWDSVKRTLSLELEVTGTVSGRSVGVKGRMRKVGISPSGNGFAMKGFGGQFSVKSCIYYSSTDSLHLAAWDFENLMQYFLGFEIARAQRLRFNRDDISYYYYTTDRKAYQRIENFEMGPTDSLVIIKFDLSRNRFDATYSIDGDTAYLKDVWFAEIER